MKYRIETRLSNGLREYNRGEAESIIIAGMGGNLIAEILSKAQWIKNENINIVAQPMTHAEVLRRFFVDNGFEIINEKTATDGKRLYCMMSVRYSGKIVECSVSYIYTGQLFENNDGITYKYISKMLLDTLMLQEKIVLLLEEVILLEDRWHSYYLMLMELLQFVILRQKI